MAYRNKKLYIILSLIVFSLAVTFIDAFVHPPYFSKIPIKILFFLALPMLFFVIWREEWSEFKSLFRFKKKGLLISLLLGLAIFAVILGGYFALRGVIDFSGVTTSLTSGMGITADNFVCCLAYIQPRGNKEPLGQVKIDGNENAEQLQYIESNISGEKLTYEILKQHQEEIWAYRNTAINDTVDEAFRKWGERIAAVGVNDERNCVDVYVYAFDEGDIGRFKKALGHLSYVLIQKEVVIEMIPDEKKQLTLEDVIELSVIGQDLSWEDFEAFNFKETGSGLYIRLYEIDETFSVWIGGGSPVTTPMYIYLSANGLDNRIDIRDGGVEEFIEIAAPRNEIENIIFHSERGGESEALERFYSDDKYDYYFPTIRNYVVIVYFKDGTEQTVKDALADGKITITDLDRFNIGYYREPKQGYELSRLITVAEVSEEALLGTEYYEYIHDQNEYTRYILISPTEKITDVRVTDIVLDAGLEFGNVLYVLSALDSNKPLLLGVVFYGDFTSYGIVFRDSDGVAHRFIISESGEDGSVAVQEHYFFGDV
jgi:hypothetical protein